MAGDSRDYWNQFVATVSWSEPGEEIVGTVESVDTVTGYATRKGEKPPMYPVLRIRLDNGRGVIVNGTQARLLELLVKLAPHPGDRIKITYQGEAERAAPGFSPTKEFSVRVIRKDSPPPANNAKVTSGETDNAQSLGAGK